MLLKMAWRNIWRNRTRSFITMGAIMIAVLLSNVMESFQQGVWEKMLGTTMNFTGAIQVQSPEYWDEQSLDNGFEVDDKLFKELEEVHQVKSISKRIESGALSAFGKFSRFVMIYGMDLEKEIPLLDLNSKLEAGNVLVPDSKGIMIGKGVAKYFGIGVGDTLSLIGQGHFGESANGNFIVEGIFNYGAPDMNSRMVLMPLKLAQKHLSADNIVTSYNIHISNINRARRVANILKKKFADRNVKIMSWQEMMPDLEQAYQADTGGAMLFLMVLYVIISFGIFGTILMMTTERMYEFGVLVSIGMKRFKLIIMIFYEVFFMAALSVIIGTGISYPVMYYMSTHPIQLGAELQKTMASYGFEAVIQGSTNPVILQYNAIAVVLISLIIVIYPLQKIIRMKPLKAMKI